MCWVPRPFYVYKAKAKSAKANKAKAIKAAKADKASTAAKAATSEKSTDTDSILPPQIQRISEIPEISGMDLDDEDDVNTIASGETTRPGNIRHEQQPTRYQFLLNFDQLIDLHKAIYLFHV